MPLNLDIIRDRLNSIQNQAKKQDTLWKPPVGKTIIRIVPYKFNKDNPFIELLFHYNLAGKTYLSPASFGRPDPILEFSDKLRATGTKKDYSLAKLLEPKLRTYAPIVVRGEESKGVKFWGFGKTVYEELLKIIADPDFGDITDPAGGRDITIEFQAADESSKKSFPKTTIRVKPNKSMLVNTKEDYQAILDSQKDITEIYKELTYEQLEEVLTAWLKPENQAAQSAKATSKVEVDDEDDSVPVKKSDSTIAKNATVITNVDDLSAQFQEMFEN